MNIGRPRKEVDWSQVDAMCEIHCTGEEQASVLGMSYETLNTRCKEDHGISFLEYFKQKSAAGKMSLRRKQYTTAMEGDKTMMVWLGKNWLGQSDQIESETRDIPPINITVKPSGTDNTAE